MTDNATHFPSQVRRAIFVLSYLPDYRVSNYLLNVVS
jgi:hypothetical protein